MYEDDLEEETMQADAEPVEKEMVNDAHTLLSVVTTGKAQRVHLEHQCSVARRECDCSTRTVSGRE